jgi:hypothetical protein
MTRPQSSRPFTLTLPLVLLSLLMAFNIYELFTLPQLSIAWSAHVSFSDISAWVHWSLLADTLLAILVKNAGIAFLASLWMHMMKSLTTPHNWRLTKE